MGLFFNSKKFSFVILFLFSNALSPLFLFGDYTERVKIQGVSPENSYYYYSLIPPISQDYAIPNHC